MNETVFPPTRFWFSLALRVQVSQKGMNRLVSSECSLPFVVRRWRRSRVEIDIKTKQISQIKEVWRRDAKVEKLRPSFSSSLISHKQNERRRRTTRQSRKESLICLLLRLQSSGHGKAGIGCLLFDEEFPPTAGMNERSACVHCVTN